MSDMTLTLMGYFVSHDISKILSLQYTINTKLLNIPVLILSLCQEAFNRRRPVCCFGSVRNSLFLMNIQELRGEASLSRGLRNPGISLLVFLYGDKYPLPFYEPYGKSGYLQLTLFHMDDLVFP